MVRFNLALSLVSLDSGLELEVLGGFPPTETGWQSCMTPPSSTDTDAIVSLLWTFSVNLFGQTRLQCENIAGLPSFQWNVSSVDSYIWLPTIRMTFWRGSAWLRFLINSLCFPCILPNSLWLRTNRLNTLGPLCPRVTSVKSAQGLVYMEWMSWSHPDP